MELRNFFLMLIYLGENPGRLPYLVRNKAISRTFVIKNDSMKLAYIVNPKVASSSITALLASDVDVESLEGKPTRQKHALLQKRALHTYDEISRLREAGYFVFSFVRNPYARIVSFYKNKFEPAGNGYLRTKRFAIKHQFRKMRDFNDVVRVICNTPDYLSDAHFMSQTRILFGPDGVNHLDFIGKLEKIDEDFDIISRRANLGPIGRRNPSSSANQEWMDYFTPDLAHMIHERFKSDFDLLGYADEHRNLMAYLQNPNAGNPNQRLNTHHEV